MWKLLLNCIWFWLNSLLSCTCMQFFFLLGLCIMVTGSHAVDGKLRSIWASFFFFFLIVLKREWDGQRICFLPLISRLSSHDDDSLRSLSNSQLVLLCFSAAAGCKDDEREPFNTSLITHWICEDAPAQAALFSVCSRKKKRKEKKRLRKERPEWWDGSMKTRRTHMRDSRKCLLKPWVLV